MSSTNPPDASSATLHARQRQVHLVRFALLLGVVLFGVLSWFMHRDPAWQPVPGAVETLRVPTWIVWAVGIIGVLIFRGIHARAGEEARLNTALIGPAFGEGVALFGGVYHFQTDDPWRYLYGVLFLLATFMLFPVRRH